MLEGSFCYTLYLKPNHPIDLCIRDTCPDQPGLDLIRKSNIFTCKMFTEELMLTQSLTIDNYMSYSNDECRDSWTLGQIQRMREQMAKFRGVVYPGIIIDDIPEDS